MIYFTDEAGIRSDYHGGTTWTPAGQTLVAKTTGAHHGINMISAITAKGAPRFAVYQGALTAAVFIDFLTRLLHDAPRPIYLVVDGHPAHRARVTKEFVASTTADCGWCSCLPTHPSSTPMRGSGPTPARPHRPHQHRQRRRQGHRRATPPAEDAPHVRALFSDPHLTYINP